MTVLISSLPQNSGCFVSKKGFAKNSFYYKCDQGHPILKEYCDFKFLKVCSCGAQIQKKDVIYRNTLPNNLESSTALNKVKVPNIFKIDNAPCNTKSLIAANTFDEIHDLPTSKLWIETLIIDASMTSMASSESKVNVNQKNWRGNTRGHELLLCDSYYNLYDHLVKLYEMGLDIFIENNSGFCLAHIIDIQKHYVKWYCEKHGINPYEELDDAEFLLKVFRN
jgi:hypothetical protein